MKTGIELIAEERKRQIESEGWTLQHDDEHNSGELYRAAQCYHYQIESGFPWDKKWWKPKGLVRNYVKAGALVQAEIDRLSRYRDTIADEIDNYHRNSV